MSKIMLLRGKGYVRIDDSARLSLSLDFKRLRKKISKQQKNRIVRKTTKMMKTSNNF